MVDRHRARAKGDLVCFTRHRWGIDATRERALMTRFARSQRVFVVEEPQRDGHRRAPFLEVRAADGLVVLTPQLPAHLDALQARREVASLVVAARGAHAIDCEVAWVDDMGSQRLAALLEPRLAVWDCPHESRIDAASTRADLILVTTHGAAEQRRRRHPAVHVLPNAVEPVPFADLRDAAEPLDQARIHGPRIGVAARIDASLDLALLRDVVDDRPELQFIVLGAPEVPHRELPCRPNLHWLGAVRRELVPQYLAAWDLAIAPLVPHAELRGVAPLEALVAGHLLVATASRDLAAQVGASSLVRWSDRAGFGRAIESALRDASRVDRRAHVDAIRAQLGWDCAFARLEGWLESAAMRRERGVVDTTLERSSA